MLPPFDLIAWVESVAPPTAVAPPHTNGQAAHAANGTGDLARAAYAQRALDYELAILETAPPGTRNDALNKAAFALGQIVAAGLLDAGRVEAELTAYARALGLGDAEISATVRSGLGKGGERPRDLGRVGQGGANGFAGIPAGAYGPAGYAAPPGGGGNGHAPHAIDVAALTAQAEAFTRTAAHRLEVLYLAREFLADLARLELSDGGAAEAVKAVLRRIPGFVSRPFEKAMGEPRGAATRERKARAQAAPGDERVVHEFTDLGNGRRLVDLHGHHIRHCKAYGDWMIYDGQRWVKDEMYEVEKMAQDIPKRVLLDMPTSPDTEAIEACTKWAVASQSKEKLTAMTHTARSMVAVTPDHLDRDPWLLNVQNGTIDLKTGAFREARPNDLVTKLAAVVYDPDATAPRWEDFVLEIMGGNRDLADYLRRAVGYSITGVIREHALFFLYGTGRNGKTTWLNTLFNTLGDYANQIDSDLLVSQNYAQHPTGLTELEGRRLVAADEADEDRRLAEAQVKKLTGGNPIQARRMQKDFYTFRPTHHLFFAANHKPEIRGMDAGIWRRIKLIPFEVAFDLKIKGAKVPDLEMEDKLLKERPGILNWMLRGCREWQERGLDEPPVIRQLGHDYQSEMDVLGAFVEETCIVEDDARVAILPLYLEYKAWCETNGCRSLSKRKFTMQLADKSFKTFKSNSVAFKVGLRLKTVGERALDAQAAYEAAGGVGRAVGAGGDMLANGRGPGEIGDMGDDDGDWTRRR